MLVKLAFVMQRLKKYLKKNFVMINKDRGGGDFKILWGDTAVMRGDIELMGGSPSPPTRENPAYQNEGWKSINCQTNQTW